MEENKQATEMYMVFIPQHAEEFALAHLGTADELGLGHPHEIEVYHGSAEECRKFIEETDYHDILLVRDEGAMRVYTPAYHSGERPGAEIVFRGNYRQVLERIRAAG